MNADDVPPDDVVRAFTLALVRADGCCTCDPTIELAETVVLDDVPGVGRILGTSPVVYHHPGCWLMLRQHAPSN